MFISNIAPQLLRTLLHLTQQADCKSTHETV